MYKSVSPPNSLIWIDFQSQSKSFIIAVSSANMTSWLFNTNSKNAPWESPRKTVMGESVLISPVFEAFFYVTPNLFRFWQTIEEACPRLASHLVAGGKQLDTAISRPADDIKACGSEWYDSASADSLCESISKIIHSAMATHFCLPASIRVLRGEDDRRGAGGAWGASV